MAPRRGCCAAVFGRSPGSALGISPTCAAWSRPSCVEKMPTGRPADTKKWSSRRPRTTCSLNRKPCLCAHFRHRFGGNGNTLAGAAAAAAAVGASPTRSPATVSLGGRVSRAGRGVGERPRGPERPRHPRATATVRAPTDYMTAADVATVRDFGHREQVSAARRMRRW